MYILKRNYPKIIQSLRPTTSIIQATLKPHPKGLLRPFTSSPAISFARAAPNPPPTESKNLRTGEEAPTFLGTTKRLPEFNLVDHVVLVSGGAGGLGLSQSEALLEARANGKNPNPL